MLHLWFSLAPDLVVPGGRTEGWLEGPLQRLRQLRQGQERLGKVQVVAGGSFNEAKPLTPERPRTKVVHFKLDTDDEQPVLNLQRGRETLAEDGSTSSAVPVEKKLDFTFAMSIYSSHVSYHTVRGEKRRGLLVDPGGHVERSAHTAKDDRNTKHLPSRCAGGRGLTVPSFVVESSAQERPPSFVIILRMETV